MLLKDNVSFKGVFSITCLDKDDNVIDEYKEDNLIMDKARSNMAQLIGNVTTGGASASGQPIDRFVLGTRGHIGTDILDYQQVGETDPSKPVGDRLFASTRDDLFSQAISGEINYQIPFTAAGGLSVTENVDGVRYEGSVAVGASESDNVIDRVVNDRTVTYTISIPTQNGNSGIVEDPVVAYTEAALYAGDDIFSMKTFPARVKEDTVKLLIVWSIIF